MTDQAEAAASVAELRRQLAESLEQRAATADILEAINRSPLDLPAVLHAVVASAGRLCDADFGWLNQAEDTAPDRSFRAAEGYTYTGRWSRVGAFYGRTEELQRQVDAAFGRVKPVGGLFPMYRQTATSLAILDRKVINVADFSLEPELRASGFAKAMNARAMLVVPLLREGDAIGAIGLARLTARAFTEREVSLVQTFAAQAAIAIENVRLFNETKEALKQQTATSEVLKVISRSAFDLGPVFEGIVESASQLCAADAAGIWVRDGGQWRIASSRGTDLWPAGLHQPDLSTGRGVVGRAATERRTVHTQDAAADGMPQPERMRTRLATPILRDGEPVAVLFATREAPGGFNDRELELLTTFANQAAIAIENVRLFNETKEALEQQRAISDVLAAIASATADARPVFEVILRRAVELCDAEDAVLRRRDGEFGVVVAQQGYDGDWLGTRAPISSVTPGSRLVAMDLDVVHVPDVDKDPEFSTRNFPNKTALGIAVRIDGQIWGWMALTRREVRPFTDREIDLVRTFAAQAALAIENTRLFNETKEALDQQMAISEILQVISNSPTDVQPVLDAIARNATRFCGAEDCSVALIRDGMLEQVSQYGPITEELPRWPVDRGSLRGRAIVERQVVHVHDMQAESEQEYPIGTKRARALGMRSAVAAPLLREGFPLGAIALRRTEVKPFTEKQIGLLRTFADQAAIAIENVRLFNETKEALAQQQAVSEVLQVISRAAFDLQHVLDTLADSAARLCEAEDVVINRVVDGQLDIASHRGAVPLPTVGPRFPIGPGIVSGRAVLERRPIHVLDAMNAEDFPGAQAFARETGQRTCLAVPLLREGAAVGAILLRRLEVRPFTDRQVKLLETFADQAVIAIENVRLFNETKEALEQQTAIGEILRVISRSPTEIQPVLDAIAENAARYCQAEDATVMLPEDGELRGVAHFGPVPLAPSTGSGAGRLGYPIDRDSMNGRAFIERKVLHTADIWEQADEYPLGAAASREVGAHAALVAPLLREGSAIGTIALRRREPRPFSEHQIELVQTFADQAVIAIENVRLFNATKESLDRQTAIAEVMKTISSSVSETQRALDQVIAQATRLAEADNGFVYQLDGDVLRMTAAFGDKAEAMREWQRTNPIKTDHRGASTARAFMDRKTVHIPDVLKDPEYTYWDAQKLGGFRVLLSVPMIRDGKPLGVLALWRVEPRPFSEAHIKIVELFADQAVVAIENVRLFNETKEALEQQTATSEVLKVISRSAFDLQPVLDAVVETAGRLVRADACWMRRVEGGSYMPDVRGAGARWAVTAAMRDIVIGSGAVGTPVSGRASSVMGLVWRERRTIHVPDIAARDDLQHSTTALAIGARTVLAVPLMRQGEPLGFMVLARTRVEPFTDREIALVETFADQAAIAIENVRLFNEIQEKSRQLEVASRHKSEFLANMSHELRTPLNAIIGFTEVMLEEMFGPLNEKQKEYLDDVRGSGTHLLTLINDILDLSKIEAGRVELEITDFSFPDALENALTLVRERAARHGITIAADVAADVGAIAADERKLKQILVNLLSNAVKFTPDGGWVSVSARRADSQIQVAIRDTGIGIAPADQERIFEEFQQVGRDPDKAREGTGLGLTLAKRFVELHGGRIWVESEVGKGSTFTFAIPVRQTAMAETKA